MTRSRSSRPGPHSSGAWTGKARGRPARLLYVSRFAGGGAGTGLVDMLRALDRRLFEPAVLLLEESPFEDRLRELGVPVLHLDVGSRSARSGARATGGPVGRVRRHAVGRWIRSLPPYVWTRQMEEVLRHDRREARRILPVLQSVRPDLVHHNNTPAGNRPSILAARMAGVRQIVHVRSFCRFVALVDRALSVSVDDYLFVSRALEGHVRRGIGLPVRKGHVIYDPFDPGAYDGDGAARRDARAEFGVDVEPLIVNVGRLVPWKGQDVFLRALARVHRIRPDAKALLVGSAPGGEDDPYLRDLRRLATQLGLTDRVAFAGFRRDVPRLLAAADVVVHSSSEPEPFGRVIVEAMAARRPVVATDGGGVPDIVDDGRTGRLVRLGDPAHMAAALLELLADPESRAAMGRNARASVEERFSVERFAGEIDALYRRILGVGTPGRDTRDGSRSERDRAVQPAGTSTEPRNA